MKKSNQSAYTIVEMLVVVAIIGIVASFAVPGMTNIVKNQRISATTNEIISTLQAARSEAIKRSTDVSVCFKTTENGNGCNNLGTNVNNANYIYAFIDTDSDQTRDAGEVTIYQSNRLSEDVLFKHPSTTAVQVRRSIRFNPKGEAQFGRGAVSERRQQREGVFGLCDDRHDNTLGRTIRIGRTGRAQATGIKSGDNITC